MFYFNYVSVFMRVKAGPSAQTVCDRESLNSRSVNSVHDDILHIFILMVINVALFVAVSNISNKFVTLNSLYS